MGKSLPPSGGIVNSLTGSGYNGRVTKPKLLAGLIACVLIFALFLQTLPVSAQSPSASDLVNAVNALRASYGLPPYQVESGLMAFAQQHSEYQASIDQPTHTHSDGSTPEQDGVFENVAVGVNLSADAVVNSIWSNSLHRSTMINISAGYIGAGVASNGHATYYTIDVRKEPGAPAVPAIAPTTGSGSTAGAPAATSIPFVALATVTPRPDGAIIHTVGYGQSLWSIAIAYGVTVDDIRKLNGLAEGSVDIYAGQKLVIKAPDPTATPTPTPTATATATSTATRTPVPTRTRPAPSVTTWGTPTPRVTATPTPAPFSVANVLPDRRSLGMLLILVCAAGLGVVGVQGFRKK